MTETKSLKERWAAMEGGGPLKALQGAQNSHWLIDGVIAPNTINWVVASPESFKTFIALDMAACIASGRPWHGRSTKQTRVLYLSAEGGNDRNGVTLYTKDSTYDLANPSDQFFKSVMDAMGQLDNAQRAERTRLGKLARVKQGFWLGGPPPFGYSV